MPRRKTTSTTTSETTLKKTTSTKKTKNAAEGGGEEQIVSNPPFGSSWVCFYDPNAQSADSSTSSSPAAAIDSMSTMYTRSRRKKSTTNATSNGTTATRQQSSSTSSDATTMNKLLQVAHFLPEGDYIKQITGGAGFTIFLTEMGGIYVFGRNSLGELGLGNYKERKEITKNSMVEMEMRSNKDKCVQVVCGPTSTIFVSEKGFAYACGCGDNGQLAIGSKHKIGKPKRIKYFDSLTDGENCVEAASGNEDFSVFLTKNKKVYISGRNDHGVCDDGITIVNYPVKSEFFAQDNDVVRCFDTSKFYTVFGTENDYLYVFGKKGLAPFYDCNSRTIPSTYNYSFFYQGIKKIICVRGVCFVQNGSNKWFMFRSTDTKQAVSLDDYLGDNVCPAFKSSKDTIVSVGSDKEGMSVALSKQKRVFKITSRDCDAFGYIRPTYRNEVSIALESHALTEELKALSPLEDENISVAVSNDRERKLRNLTSDQRWFMNNLNTLVDELKNENVLGKRSGGVGSHSIVVDESKLVFSDIIVSSFSIRAVSQSQSMQDLEDSETFEQYAKKMKK
ncbi:hypothetical protein C9374_005312 [Naegleria lovaniensis]|uniref:Uncharacterized protein n=1 Tax=Naegleria lovaniensis TaxID=51637 RepID=A0AA88GR07_NAELO|nr:uncharacterized protein C9374_005312 [Naegleria lovaniensis]KAG2382732.1 hypothetical protein C9374_005312 [Naegleria lovaniensis]